MWVCPPSRRRNHQHPALMVGWLGGVLHLARVSLTAAALCGTALTWPAPVPTPHLLAGAGSRAALGAGADGAGPVGAAAQGPAGGSGALPRQVRGGHTGGSPGRCPSTRGAGRSQPAIARQLGFALPTGCLPHRHIPCLRTCRSTRLPTCPRAYPPTAYQPMPALPSLRTATLIRWPPLRPRTYPRSAGARGAGRQPVTAGHPAIQVGTPPGASGSARVGWAGLGCDAQQCRWGAPLLLSLSFSSQGSSGRNCASLFACAG
jgi:hypothetical protein